jgi:phosphoserine phosphatase
MNVYDFDKTIYRGDSTMRFILYLLRRQPGLLVHVPAFSINALLFITGRRKKQDFKERMFRAFFGHAKDIDKTLADFWKLNVSRVFKWYRKTQQSDDVVISASPVDIVRPCCEMLGIKCIMGSPVDLKTGVYSGPNCHGEEKVRRFYEAFPGAVIENFYSDSHSDDPMARIAEKSWMVTGETLTPWKFE